MIIDHVALEVADLDERVARLEALGLRVLRVGARHRTGQRIVMMGDGTGAKLELIEADGTSQRPVFAHLALRSDDPDRAHRHLVDQGWASRSEPHDLPAARARSALVGDGAGFDVQVIAYEPDSPDIATWAADPDPMPGPGPAAGRDQSDKPSPADEPDPAAGPGSGR